MRTSLTASARIVAAVLVTMAMCGCELLIGNDERVVESTAVDAAVEASNVDGASTVVSPPLDAQPGSGDASVVSPPADASPSAVDAAARDASPCALCVTEADVCRSACVQTSASCRSRCMDNGCVGRCTRDEQHCEDDCVKTCSTCSQHAACGATSDCGGGQNGN